MIPPSVMNELGKHLAFGAFHLGKFAVEKLNEAASSRTIGGSRPESVYQPNLGGANRPNLRRADLRGADLRRANLYDADLYKADLQGATLQGATLEGAILYKADLQGANLYKADLQGTTLQEANLRYADLRYANLQRLQGVDFRGADLRYANLRGATGLIQEQLEQAIGNEVTALSEREGLRRPKAWSKSIEEQREILARRGA